MVDTLMGAGRRMHRRESDWDRRLQIYEVDHPATQAWKRERLAGRWLAVPDNLRWAPIDCEQLRSSWALPQEVLTDASPAATVIK